MSAKEREEYIPFLLARDGYRCDLFCNKSVDELLEIREYEEMVSGEKMKLPVLYIDHKDDNSNKTHGDNGEYCGNIHLGCAPCNRNKIGMFTDTSQSSGKAPTREKLDRIQFEGAYHRNLRIYLLDNEEICFEELKLASKKLSEGGNQVTVMRYFGDERHTKANPTGKYQIFPYNCGASYCNGNHVCLTGTRPEILIAREKYTLERNYSAQYAGGNKEEFSATTKKPFIEFEEFYLQHALIGTYAFITDNTSHQPL